MNLQIVLDQACRLWRDHCGLIDGDVEFTYGALLHRAKRAGATLRALAPINVPRVAVLLSNRWEYAVLDMACAYAGITLVRMNARDGAREAAYILRDSAADYFIYSTDFEEIAQSALSEIAHAVRCITLPPTATTNREAAFDELFDEKEADARSLTPETVYKLMYTSGTTGKPKGVVVTHDQWCCAVLQNLYLAPLGDVSSTNCFLHVTPLTHVSGGLFWAFMMRGARQVICPSTSVEAIAGEVARCGVTHAFLVPTLVSKLVSATPEQQAVLRGMERIYYAASPIGVRTLRAAVDLYGPIFAQGYGSTEAMWWLTYFYPDEHAAALESGNIERLSSCGRPSLGIEIKIVDEDGRELPPGEMGEVATRGRHVAKAYLNRGEVPRDSKIGDGWFRLGDMGYADADGFFYLVDRKSSMIITGGFNVYPSEVEAVMLGCAGVAECCVIGAPDDHWGEIVATFIVRATGSTISDEQILEFGRGALPDYKRPRKIMFVEDLPVNSGGKVDRRALRESLWADQQRRI